MLIFENAIVNLLYKIDHPVGSSLIYTCSTLEYVKDYEFKELHNKYDVNFIMLGPNGVIELSTKKQISEVIATLPPTKLHVSAILQELFTRKLRIRIKPGRLITKLNITMPNISDNSKAKFGELFTERVQVFESNASSIKIISGVEIEWAYNGNNYAYDTGELASSCMRYDACQNYFSLYKENPDIVKMAVNIIDGKVAARCLLWLDKYYDRIYFANYNIYLAMLNYVETAGYQRIYYREYIDRPNVSIHLPRPFAYYEPYPYLDSFKYVNVNENTLNLNSIGCAYVLNSTEGEYNEVYSCVICGINDIQSPLNYHSIDGEYYCDTHLPIYEES